MIDEIYSKLKENAVILNGEQKNRQFHPSLLLPIEKELLNHHPYQRQVPVLYSEYEAQRYKGNRASYDTIHAAYCGILFFGSITTLHIAEEGRKKNLDAIVLLYHRALDLNPGQAPYSPKDSPDNRASSGESSLVVLAENGVISSFYANMTNKEAKVKGLITSWHPDGKEGYAVFPYPEEKEDVDFFLFQVKLFMELNGATNALQSLPELVMLAKTSYQSFAKKE